MQTFMEFRTGQAHAFAAAVRDGLIYKETSLYDAREFFDPRNKAMMDKALTPDKRTLLHDFIEEAINADLDYSTSKTGDLMVPELKRMLEVEGVTFVDKDSFDNFDGSYEDYLLELVQDHAVPRIVLEVFNVLFLDRGFLKAFNSLIAAVVADLDASDHPAHLKRDGVFERCTYWPTWLKDGLYRRDKGHCAICQCDLSGVFARGAELHIDHIIPLNLGGVNDPTNLQLLCDTCNGNKGGTATTTTEMVANFW